MPNWLVFLSRMDLVQSFFAVLWRATHSNRSWGDFTWKKQRWTASILKWTNRSKFQLAGFLLSTNPGFVKSSVIYRCWAYPCGVGISLVERCSPVALWGSHLHYRDFLKVEPNFLPTASVLICVFVFEGSQCLRIYKLFSQFTFSPPYFMFFSSSSCCFKLSM